MVEGRETCEAKNANLATAFYLSFACLLETGMEGTKNKRKLGSI
jgi:hypothetical protein